MKLAVFTAPPTILIEVTALTTESMDTKTIVARISKYALTPHNLKKYRSSMDKCLISN